jgi:hypothetical protein
MEKKVKEWIKKDFQEKVIAGGKKLSLKQLKKLHSFLKVDYIKQMLEEDEGCNHHVLKV